MNGIRIQTTLFELAAALQGLCDDDREIVRVMTRWLSPDRRVLRSPSSPHAGGASPMPQEAGPPGSRCD